jgi:SAM-dependent methyltransferase
MVEMGRVRSGAAGVAVEWLEGDAENLPFPKDDFDVVASVFGAMFAPRPELVAKELFRVARPGGLVAMANYGWNGHLGSVARLMTSYSSRAPMDLPSPFEWGDEAEVRRRFGGLASRIEIEPATIRMALASVEQGIAFWERTNGPHMALRTLLPADRYLEFRRDAEDLMREMNRSRDGHLELESSYLRVLARK